MRWQRGPSREERDNALGGWHDWFAWHPVAIGQTEYWMETVQRRGRKRTIAVYESCGVMPEDVWEWEYRTKDGDNENKA